MYNEAMLKRLGIKKEQIQAEVKQVARGKETTDSTKVKDARQKMNMEFIKYSDLFSANFFAPKYARDDKNKILKDKNGESIVEKWIPKVLNGQFILEDNGDGTHTATKLNVYKETTIVDSDSINLVKKS